jgi:DnaK suppressor protein
VAKKVSSKKADKMVKKAPKASAKDLKKAVKALASAAAEPKAAKPVLKKSPMSKAELEEFRKLLLDKRRSLIGDMNGMESEALRLNRQDAGGDLSLMPDHPANIATDNFEQEFTLGLLESERTLLTEINEALERIDNGTYGICLGTGEAISKPRLTARPWAKYTIEYARLLEKGQVRLPERSVEMPDEEPSGEEEPDEEPEEELPEPSSEE